MAKTRVRVELLSDGIAALMQLPEMAAEVDAAAQRIASIAGPEFEVRPAEPHGDRVMALVIPTDEEGRELEARDKTLTKAVHACRS